MFKIMIIRCLIFSIFFIHITSAFYYNDTPYIDNIKNDVYFKNYHDPLFNQTIDFLELLSKHDEINSACRSSLRRWIRGIDDNELWALKCRTINGKLTGRNVNFGSFDYCAEFTGNEIEQIDFDGKYCLVSVQTRDSEDIKSLAKYKNYQKKVSVRSRRVIDFNLGNAHGVCMPSTCDINEITLVFNKKFKSFGFSLLPPKRCTTISEPEPLTNLQIIAFTILISFILLCLLANFVQNDFLSNFSLSDNYNTIYSYETTEDESKLFLHGVKFLLIIVSISLHAMTVLGGLFAQPYGTIKEAAFTEYLQKFLGRAQLFADIMFFYGGFFSMYAWYDVIKNGKMKYNFFNFFVMRYAKIAIISIIIILITWILPHLGTGPYYSDITDHLYQNCKFNGWKNFLLISNEQRVLDMCIIPAWYLSADFQVYILNYFVIYYLITKPKLGFLLAFGQMFIVSALTLIYIQRNNIPVIMNVFDLYVYDVSAFEDSYLHSFYHYNTYVIGLICAWLIKNQVKPNFLRFKIVRIILTVTAFASFQILLDYLYRLEKSGSKQSELLNFFWPIIDKFITVLGPFWIFYSVLIGYSAPLKKIFSARFTIPWSRLSFSLIMCQFTYLIYSLSSARTVFPYNRMTAIKELFSGFLFTFMLGNFLYLFFEAPMFNLLRSYLGLKRRREMNNDKKVL